MPRADKELVILAHKGVPDHVMQRAENLAHAAAMSSPQYRLGVLPAVYHGRPVHALSRVWQDPTNPDVVASEPIGLLLTEEEARELQFPTAEQSGITAPEDIERHLPKEPLDLGLFSHRQGHGPQDAQEAAQEIGVIKEHVSDEDFQQIMKAFLANILRDPDPTQEKPE